MSKKKEHSKLLPELRFPEFEGGDIDNIYKRYSFTDVFHFSTGKNIKQSEASPEFKIPCVRYGELYHMYNEVIYEVINKTNLDSSELRFSKGDEILLPSAGEDPLDIGSASALTLANVAIGRTINILRPLQENVYSQIYVSYYINEKLRRKISTLAKGSSISNVYNSDLRKLEISLPSISEQQKIANTLTSLDSWISAENEKLEALKAHKKGLLQQLFPAKGEKVPKLRFGEFEWEWEWEETTLGEVAKFRRGSFPQPYGLDKWYDDVNGMPFIQVYDVGFNLKLKPKTKRKISQLAANQSVFIEKGTVIITIQGSIGRVAITQYDAYIDRTLLLFQEFFRPINRLFFAYVIQALFEIEKKKAPGGIIKTITKEVLTSFNVHIPDILEQQKIADCLSSLDELIAAQSEKIEGLQAHKKGLMQQLFPTIKSVNA